jgi:hypothetical protein
MRETIADLRRWCPLAQLGSSDLRSKELKGIINRNPNPRSKGWEGEGPTRALPCRHHCRCCLGACCANGQGESSARRTSAARRCEGQRLCAPRRNRSTAAHSPSRGMRSPVRGLPAAPPSTLLRVAMDGHAALWISHGAGLGKWESGKKRRKKEGRSWTRLRAGRRRPSPSTDRRRSRE